MRLLAASGLQAAPVLRSGSMPFLASNLRKSITRQASLFGGAPDFIVLGDAHAHHPRDAKLWQIFSFFCSLAHRILI